MQYCHDFNRKLKAVMKFYRLQSRILKEIRQNVFNEIVIRNVYERLTHLNFQNIPQ